MAKSVKSSKSNRQRKGNKARNLKKKKKSKAKNKKENGSVAMSEKQFEHRMMAMCKEFKRVCTSKAIVTHKLHREKRKHDRDMSELCKDLKYLLKFNLKTDNVVSSADVESEDVVYPVVEDLSKNVQDLIISNQNFEPGFKFTRWQQKKFLQKIRDIKQYNS